MGPQVFATSWRAMGASNAKFLFHEIKSCPPENLSALKSRTLVIPELSLKIFKEKGINFYQLIP